MTISQLQKMRPVLNVAELARRSGINENTLLGKIHRGSELSVVESEAIEDALVDVGLRVERSRKDASG